MTLRTTSGRWAMESVWRLLALVLLMLAPSLVFGQDKVQVIATQESGYARMVLTFPNRMDLPPYSVKFDNNVLAIQFTSPLNVLLPDIATAIPDFVTVARVDPDNKGIRIGLRSTVNINRLEAGEKLFIDLLPPTWQGLPPALPPEVVAELAEKARKAKELADQQQRAALAKALNPIGTVRVGQNPTFLRIQFDWNADTDAKFDFSDGMAKLLFDWPVPVDLYPLQADMPAELQSATNSVGPEGSTVTLKVAPGVVPRFYQNDAHSFVVDIDISPEEGMAAALNTEQLADLAKKASADATREENQQRELRLGMDDQHGDAPAGADSNAASMSVPGTVTPTVSTSGSTVRVAFPFSADTAAAVFRRGDTVWMVFDTGEAIVPPPPSDALNAIATGIEILPAGDTKVVRLDLSADRLATLGSEGRSWVLSLGDTVLGATEPMTLTRERDTDGHFDMRADIERPGQVHVLRDPVVGDTLRVVTMMPPARGLTRDLSFVDFNALRSAHGLVIKPLNDHLDVSIDDKTALISAPDGLTVSAAEGSNSIDALSAPEFRESYVDLSIWREDDPGKLMQRQSDVENRAANAEGRQRDQARLDLATLMVANDLDYEAIGILRLLSDNLSNEDLRKKIDLMRAIADTLAHRPADALPILNGGTFPHEADALMWRTIAKEEAGDFKGARLDALASDSVLANYPDWIRKRFQFAAIRAAVETNDSPMALKVIGEVEFAKLEPEEVSQYQLMQGRISELNGKDNDALDTYGQVIASEFRPTRAEAVYRTLAILEKTGQIDLAKATQTLAAEAMMWRGGTLEADMDKLLAELYFKDKDYRNAFATTQQVVARFPDNPSITALTDEATKQFEDLYLNGGADQLKDVDALSLYYDYRQLTPIGTRGDEMIRNLARRLVKVDLLAQAGDLLQYQVDNRLKGVARAQVAADLALIRIADRKPDAAIKVLNDTRLAELPPQLDRQRRVLEARAMIDAGREELALELIAKLPGRDADFLRVDGFWKQKNFDGAAALLETLYAPQTETEQMTQEQRGGIIKAAVGFVLANDTLGLSRLRSKFSAQMANSAEWPIFDYVTGKVEPQSPTFRKIAGDVTGLDSLQAFLTSYKQLYASVDTVAPDKAAVPAA